MLMEFKCFSKIDIQLSKDMRFVYVVGIIELECLQKHMNTEKNLIFTEL